MKRILGAAACGVFVMTALVGCGGSDGSSTSTYCGDVKATAAQLKGLGNGSDFTADNLQVVMDAVHKLAGEAPSDVKSQWTLIDNQFATLKGALSDAGLSLSDLSKLSKGQMPPGVDLSKLTALEAKLKSIDSAKLDAAGKKINAEVKADCHIDLDKASS